jgi:hypothetical protein
VRCWTRSTKQTTTSQLAKVALVYELDKSTEEIKREPWNCIKASGVVFSISFWEVGLGLGFCYIYNSYLTKREGSSGSRPSYSIHTKDWDRKQQDGLGALTETSPLAHILSTHVTNTVSKHTHTQKEKNPKLKKNNLQYHLNIRAVAPLYLST